MSTREPSLHIRIKDAISAMKGAGISVADIESTLDRMVAISKKTNLNHRNMVINSKKDIKLSENISTSTESDAAFFANLLFLVRKRMKHRVTKHNKSSKEWTTIKKAAELAVEFSNEFQLSRKEGFTRFIETGIKLSGNKFWLTTYIGKFELIVDTYEAEQVIRKDKNGHITQDLHNIFIRKIVSTTGLDYEYFEEPLKYKYFVLAAIECIDSGVSPAQYIEAQFEALSFMGGLPSPSQLIGDKAKERLAKYMFKHSIKPSKLVKKQVNWEDILNEK